MDAFQLIRLKRCGEVLLQLDQKPIDIDCADREGQNLLQAAIANGEAEFSVQLIQRGIDINHQDSRGQTALHFTGAYRDVISADAILGAGGELATQDLYGNTPLWTAVFNARGQYEIVELFMKNGADPEKKNKAGKSPLDFALKIQDIPLIDLLQK